MNIYADESGSINNKLEKGRDFIIAIIKTNDKRSLGRSYKRFVSANYNSLLKLNNKCKTGNEMFVNGRFKELKGSAFDRDMKRKFVDHFASKNNFDLYIIHLNNSKLKDRYCENTARAFNYVMCLALKFFIRHNFLTQDNYYIQLDERNEKTKTKHFLANYLNTELVVGEGFECDFKVQYFDSSNNRFIQIADVFANIYYSNIINNQYADKIKLLHDNKILKYVFKFPM